MTDITIESGASLGLQADCVVETVPWMQDDEALVEKAALKLSNQMYLTAIDGWYGTVTEEHKTEMRKLARCVLALVDEVKGKRVFKVTMPKPTDDAATLLAMFREPDPGLGPQLRDLDDETGAFDVLNEHYRKRRT